jgi:hypothetical protein
LSIGAKDDEGHALEAELHRVGVEVLAVVELDALAQLHFPHGRRHQLGQLDGEAGDQLQVGVALHEHVEDLRGHVRGRRLLLVHGVERGRIDALGDDDLAGGRRGRDERQRQRERGESDEDAPMTHRKAS